MSLTVVYEVRQQRGLDRGAGAEGLREDRLAGLDAVGVEEGAAATGDYGVEGGRAQEAGAGVVLQPDERGGQAAAGGEGGGNRISSAIFTARSTGAVTS
jgi:hypothetical protein